MSTFERIEDLDGEIWKDLPEYAGLYQVSSKGRIKRDNHLIKPVIQKTGYLCISLCKNGVSKTYRVHKLIAKVFIPNPNNYQSINHKNGNKQDNRIENLEWCTQAYNNWHARFILNKKQNKLSMEDADIIRKDVLNGKYKNIKEISEKYECNRAIIENILANRYYKTNSSYPIKVLRRKNILCKEIINNIRTDYINTEISAAKIAKKYNITRGLAQNIIMNKSYIDANYQYKPHITYEVGKIYGVLEILKKERRKKHTTYTCKCIYCGNIHKYSDKIKLKDRACINCNKVQE